METRVVEELQNTFICRDITLKRYVKDTSRSSQEVVNVQLGRKIVLPSKRGNKNVECFVFVDQSYYGLTSGHKTYGFSVGNKKCFETSI